MLGEHDIEIRDDTMTTKFTEFLREQATKRGESRAKRDAVIAEWTEALQALYGNVRDWLSASDPDGILSLEESLWEVSEEGLGSYKVPRLDIRGLGRLVWLVPKARYTVATAHPPQSSAPQRAAGRVDLSNEIRRFVLYRLKTDSGDQWFIEDQRNPPQPLTQEAFETALMSYLR
jgi:hypothetical protein